MQHLGFPEFTRFSLAGFPTRLRSHSRTLYRLSYRGPWNRASIVDPGLVRNRSASDGRRGMRDDRGERATAPRHLDVGAVEPDRANAPMIGERLHVGGGHLVVVAKADDRAPVAPAR